MATRTIYTASVTVPIYAGWKCQHCDENNFSDGIISCVRQTKTASFRSSKLEEAKNVASESANRDWKGNALDIISKPNSHALEIRSDLYLGHTKCTQCGKKPKWDKNMKYIGWVLLAAIICLFFGFAAISSLISGEFEVIAWAIFVPSLIAVVFGFTADARFDKKMKLLPKKYTPILGSYNTELIDYASEQGIEMPSPEEIKKALEEYNENNHNGLVFQANTDKNKNVFCRKCGHKFLEDTDVCPNCGTKVVALLTTNMATSLSKNDDENKVKENVTKPPKEKSNKKVVVTIVLLLILVLASIGLNVYQYVFVKSVNETTISNLNEEILEKQNQIYAKDSEIVELEKQIDSLSSISRSYTTLTRAIQKENLGYASKNFNASESIIVVNNNVKRDFTLTAYWSKGGEVSFRYNEANPAAAIVFNEDNWNKSTEMTIIPNRTGVSIVTFSNNVDDKTFDIIIIVR